MAHYPSAGMNSIPRTALQLVGSVAVTAAGVATADGIVLSVRTVPALFLMAAGIAGIADLARDHSVPRLERAVKRWWLAAFGAFLPYGLATAPASESAVAVGEAISGPIATVVLEAVAGGLVLGAVTMTVLYGFARYGIHPSAPTPEERILDDALDD